jgi:hypothetical protein
MILQHDRGVSWIEYIAPPKPDDPTDEMILIPEKEGYAVAVLQYENGMTDYLFRENWDLDAGARYISAIQNWLESYPNEIFLGLPYASRRDISIWIPRATLLTLQHFRVDVVISPKAVPQSGGKTILVPQFHPNHGPGKRRK